MMLSAWSHCLTILMVTVLLPTASQAKAAWLPLHGQVAAVEHISAMAIVDGYLWLAADETNHAGDNVVQQFSRDGRLLSQLRLSHGDELDSEAMAAEGHTLYVMGSHSAKRKKLKAGKSYQRNRRMLNADEIRPENNRARLYRLQLNDQGEATDVGSISLQQLLRQHPVLAPFSRLPSKENGIDIEGLAVRNGILYAGFRGPVLRGGMTPVLRFRMNDAAATARLLFVQLHGLGIRGMTEVSDGLLLLAGPTGDLAGPYAVYHWDGQDMVPGDKRHGSPLGHSRLLGQLRHTGGSKPEAIALLRETADAYQLLLAVDSAPDASHAVRQMTLHKR